MGATLSSTTRFEALAGSTVYPAATATSLRDQEVHRPPQQALELGQAFASDKKRHGRLQIHGKQYFGQFGEDCNVRALLQAAGLQPDSPSDKVFLETGALNGIRYSNSLAFERSGWRGVLIEANPGNCRELEESRRSGRTVNICTAVCAAGPIEFEFVKSATSRLASMNPNATAAQRARRVRVPCLPLSQILSELRVPRLNYFSLDVEGGEEIVLRTFPWSSVAVDVLEWEGRLQSVRGKAVAAILDANGMVRLDGKNHADNMYVSRAVYRQLNSSSFTEIVKKQGRANPSFACRQW